MVKLLLEKGADAKVRASRWAGRIGLGGELAGSAMVQLLLDRGATRPLPLAAAIAMGCQECFETAAPARPAAGPQRGAARRRHGWATCGRSTCFWNAERKRRPPYCRPRRSPQPRFQPPRSAPFSSRGANPALKTSFGLTTLDFARRQGNDGFVKILMEAGIREESSCCRPIHSPSRPHRFARPWSERFRRCSGAMWRSWNGRAACPATTTPSRR